MLENQSFLELQKLQNDISNDSAQRSHFSTHNGILHYIDKPYLSKNLSFIPLFLQEFHAIPVGGHAGVPQNS